MPRTLADDPQKPTMPAPKVPLDVPVVPTVGDPGPIVQPPMKPMQSTTVKSLILVGLGQLLLALIPMLQAHAVDFWSLGTTEVPIIAGILIRMGMGDVQVPAVLNAMSFGILNSSNPKPKV